MDDCSKNLSFATLSVNPQTRSSATRLQVGDGLKFKSKLCKVQNRCTNHYLAKIDLHIKTGQLKYWLNAIVGRNG